MMPRNVIRVFSGLGLTVLAASFAQAGPVEFDFKDPKKVNSVAFFLDSTFEPFNGIATGVSGKITFDPASPSNTSGNITIETKSLVLANRGMQDTMLGAEWLDAKKNPKIEFTVKRVTDAKKASEMIHELTVVGDMTVRGVTRELSVAVKLTYLPNKLDERSSSMKGDLLMVRSNFTIKRKDFGIKPDASDKVVAEEIEIRVSVAGVNVKK